MAFAPAALLLDEAPPLPPPLRPACSRCFFLNCSSQNARSSSSLRCSSSYLCLARSHSSFARSRLSLNPLKPPLDHQDRRDAPLFVSFWWLPELASGVGARRRRSAGVSAPLAPPAPASLGCLHQAFQRVLSPFSGGGCFGGGGFDGAFGGGGGGGGGCCGVSGAGARGGGFESGVEASCFVSGGAAAISGLTEPPNFAKEGSLALAERKSTSLTRRRGPFLIGGPPPGIGASVTPRSSKPQLKDVGFAPVALELRLPAADSRLGAAAFAALQCLASSAVAAFGG